MLGESDRRFQLADGRLLGYCELGDPHGELIFFVGGYPGSRWMAHLFAGSLIPGVRLVGIDRPGMGLSDFKPGWRMLDWPDDLVELANHFHRERFAILGWSGGAPYAAACAYKIPGHLSACGLMACMGPPGMSVKGAMLRNRVWPLLARRAPWSLGLMIWLLYGKLGSDPKKFEAALIKMQTEISEADRKAYARQEILSVMANAMAEAFRQGLGGQTYEARLLYLPWGFRLEDIHHGRIFLWHGEQDRNIPSSTGHAIAQAIPNCKGVFYPDDGHLSIIVDRASEILSCLVS